MSVRCPRRAIVALVGNGQVDERCARALLESLGKLGVETVYLGRGDSAEQIAAAVAQQRADAVELCLTGPGGVLLLRELLRQLIKIGRRDVSIVVHRNAQPVAPARNHPGDRGSGVLAH
jgi:methylmalonyl-CoA mutase cobalamin-binding subunit